MVLPGGDSPQCTWMNNKAEKFCPVPLTCAFRQKPSHPGVGGGAGRKGACPGSHVFSDAHQLNHLHFYNISPCFSPQINCHSTMSAKLPVPSISEGVEQVECLRKLENRKQRERRSMEGPGSALLRKPKEPQRPDSVCFGPERSLSFAVPVILPISYSLLPG